MLHGQEKPELTRAAKLVLEKGYSCALCSGQNLYTSYRRGVIPLIHFLTEDIYFKDAYAADKVIGKASALLLVLAGVKSAYAPVMSESGLYILSYYGVLASCDICVPAILNRAGTGPCPMEEAMEGIKDPVRALGLLQRFIES